MKKSSMIDLKDVPSGDERFHRHEYWGVDTLFILHYVGDCSIFEGFAHRNSKYKRPFIRSAPCVKEKVNVTMSDTFVLSLLVSLCYIL